MGFHGMCCLCREFWVFIGSVGVNENLVCDLLLSRFQKFSSSFSVLFHEQKAAASTRTTDLSSTTMSRSSLLFDVSLDSDLNFLVFISTSFKGSLLDLLCSCSYLRFGVVVCSQRFACLKTAAIMKTLSTSTTTTPVTAITAPPNTDTAAPIQTPSQTPIQAPIQTVPVRYRPIHTVTEFYSQIQSELVTNCYFSLVLFCYFSYFEKWMDHLLILTFLLCGGRLNCLVLFLTIQTWPLKLNLKNLEKWMDHLLILTCLPWAVLLICLGLFRTSQTLPFNPALSICWWHSKMVVVVELSDLWRTLRDDGGSLISIFSCNGCNLVSQLTIPCKHYETDQ